MKLKKWFIRVIVVWSIFFISSMSFGWIVSLQDDSLNSFWTVKKLDISFIANTYAESGGQESGEKESGWYEKESWNYSNTSRTTTTTNTANISNPNQTCTTVYDTVTTASGEQVQEPRTVCWANTATSVTSTSQVESNTQTVVQNTESYEQETEQEIVVEDVAPKLSDEEKLVIKERFATFLTRVDAKKYSSAEKFDLYNRVNVLIDDKIATLRLLKIKITDVAILEKYNKKILLFSEINNLVYEQILVYIDSSDFDIAMVKEKVPTPAREVASTQETQVTTNLNVSAADEKRAADAKSRAEAQAISQAKEAEQARIAAAQRAAAAAAEKDAAQVRAAEQARIAAAQAAAAEQARLDAAQQAAANQADTTTTAS